MAVVAWSAACSLRSDGWQRAATAGEEGDAEVNFELLREGRWVLLPDYGNSDFVLDDERGGRHLISFGLRLILRPDGSLVQSRDFIPADSVRAFLLPERLGGGYLFFGERGGETMLWRADDWTSKLEPVARVAERVEATVVGFDRLYVQLPLSHRWGAIDLTTGEARDLSPLPRAPGFGSMAFADAWFGAVVTDVQGVLVTFDAGSSWHSLDGMGKEPSVSAAGGDVVIESGGERYRLSHDGVLRRYSTPDGQELFEDELPSRLMVEEREVASVASPGQRFDNALRDAVLYGMPRGDGYAIVATQGALLDVRLSDGAVMRYRANAYPGDEPCQAVRLGAGVGFVCHQLPRGTKLYRLKPPLDLVLERSFGASRRVASSGNGALVLSGRCNDVRDVTAGQHHCVRSREGEYSEVRVRGDVGVERVVALEDGRTVLLIPPRLGSAGVLTVVEDGEQRSTELELPDDEQEAAFLESGLWLDQLSQLSAQRVGTWVVGSRDYRGVTVDLDGKVDAHAPPDGGNVSRAVFRGAIAFEASPGGVAWTSTDFGGDWVRSEAPPGFYPLEERSSLTTLGPSPRVGCSLLGCVYGPWAMIGYPGTDDELPAVDGGTSPPEGGDRPDDAPEGADDAEDDDEGSLTEAELPKRANFNPSSYFEWRPECHALGEQGPRAAGLGRQLNALAKERPHRGLTTGFSTPLLGMSPQEEGSDKVFPPFRGVPGPNVGQPTLRFDTGSDVLPRFHAYAWGGSSAQWASTGVWQVRVAPSFDEEAVWATAPTHAPWPDAARVGDLFGPRERSGVEWVLHLDPDEQGGVLRIGSNSVSELHVLNKGRAIQSYGGIQGGRLAGAVRVGGEWLFGRHEGNDFQIHRLSATGPVPLGSYFVAGTHQASVVRSTDGERLGILVRTRGGDWHVYPLSDRYDAEPPLSLTRERLNASPPRCDVDSTGWLVRAPTPLTRFDGQAGASTVTFAGPLSDWRAKYLFAKVIVHDGAICVAELAAEVAHKPSHESVPTRSGERVPEAVPLTLDDAFLNRHVSFRCSL